MAEKPPKKQTKPQDRPWRGSKLAMDIVTHDNGVPTLQVTYSARIPLKMGASMQDLISQGRGVAEMVSAGLMELPTVDKLDLRLGKPLREQAHQGRREQR